MSAANRKPAEEAAALESSSAKVVTAVAFERAVKDLNELRGIVVGGEIGGLDDTIQKVDAEVTAEIDRVRDAIAELDDRLTSRLDSLAVSGDSGRQKLRDELRHSLEEIGETLAKSNDKIRATAKSEFAELRERLLDTSAFEGLVKSLVTQLEG